MGIFSITEDYTDKNVYMTEIRGKDTLLRSVDNPIKSNIEPIKNIDVTEIYISTYKISNNKFIKYCVYLPDWYTQENTKIYNMYYFEYTTGRSNNFYYTNNTHQIIDIENDKTFPFILQTEFFKNYSKFPKIIKFQEKSFIDNMCKTVDTQFLNFVSDLVTKIFHDGEKIKQTFLFNSKVTNLQLFYDNNYLPRIPEKVINDNYSTNITHVYIGKYKSQELFVYCEDNLTKQDNIYNSYGMLLMEKRKYVPNSHIYLFQTKYPSVNKDMSITYTFENNNILVDKSYMAKEDTLYFNNIKITRTFDYNHINLLNKICPNFKQHRYEPPIEIEPRKIRKLKREKLKKQEDLEWKELVQSILIESKQILDKYTRIINLLTNKIYVIDNINLYDTFKFSDFELDNKEYYELKTQKDNIQHKIKILKQKISSINFFIETHKKLNREHNIEQINRQLINQFHLKI
jgi:hypothetical protein